MTRSVKCREERALEDARIFVGEWIERLPQRFEQSARGRCAELSRRCARIEALREPAFADADRTPRTVGGPHDFAGGDDRGMQDETK